MTPGDYPPLNACCNALSAVSICAGWLLIRGEHKLAHVFCMSVAVAASGAAFTTLFLANDFPLGSPARVLGHGPLAVFCFGVRLSHVALGLVTMPLVVCTLIPALQARWRWHRRIGLYAMPVWLYVSVTGVIVYFMPTAAPGKI